MTAPDPVELDELEQALLDALDKYGLQTAPALAQRLRLRLGGQLAAVKRALSRMQRLGLVEPERSGHQPRWRVCLPVEPETEDSPGDPESRFMDAVRRTLPTR